MVDHAEQLINETGAIRTVNDATQPLIWAKNKMAEAGISGRALARAWGVTPASVSRWLDGTLSNSNMPFDRVVRFCQLTRMPLDDFAKQLGYTPPPPPWEALRPAPGTPPVPTVNIQPTPDPDVWRLLMHLELSPAAIASIIRALNMPAPSVLMPQF